MGAASGGGAGGVHVEESDPTTARQFPIGMQALQIAASGSVNIEVKPQVLFRGERLMLEPTITAPNFDITDIKVGKDSQLAAVGNLMGAAFVPTAVGSRMNLDTAEPGITITLSAVNTDGAAPHNFKAALFGTVME